MPLRNSRTVNFADSNEVFQYNAGTATTTFVPRNELNSKPGSSQLSDTGRSMM